MLRLFAAYFEIMDKEPTALDVWLVAAVIGTAAFFATRWRWWAGVPFMLAAAILGLGGVVEINDPIMGPAIREEAGLSYIIQSYLAVVCALAAGPLGRLSRRRAA